VHADQKAWLRFIRGYQGAISVGRRRAGSRYLDRLGQPRVHRGRRRPAERLRRAPSGRTKPATPTRLTVATSESKSAAVRVPSTRVWSAS